MWSKFNQIINIFAPPCLLCGSFSKQEAFAQGGVCCACWQDLPSNTQACIQCAIPLENMPTMDNPICGQCLTSQPPWQAGYGALLYLPPVTGLVHAFKDHNRKDCGRLLNNYLLHYLQQQNITLPDVLIPMPLHPKRLQQRGYNQAQLTADYLAKKLAITCDPKRCHRTINTPSQQGQQRSQRQHNLKRAFVADSLPEPIRRIAIIDDVLTTGASVAALCKALQKANKQRLNIQVWCLARALSPQSKLHL